MGRLGGKVVGQCYLFEHVADIMLPWTWGHMLIAIVTMLTHQCVELESLLWAA